MKNEMTAKIVEISPNELPQRLSARLIDVREPAELRGDLGKIAAAESVPLATLESAARSWDRDREIVLICQSGRRSTRAAAALVKMGFTRVMNLSGGMLAYRAAGLSLAAGAREQHGGRQ